MTKVIDNDQNGFKRALKTLQEDYEKDHNPLDLLWAFIYARYDGSAIPEWILAGLCDAIENYCLTDNASLDVIFGLSKKGHGRRPAKTKNALMVRDFHLVSCVAALVKRGMTVKDACVVSVEFNREKSPPNPEKVRQIYYKWRRDRLKPDEQYDRFPIQIVQQSTPDRIRKKYPHIFTVLP